MEEPHGLGAQGLLKGVDGGEGGLHHLADGNIVKAHHRHVPRHGDPLGGEGADGRGGHHVVLGKKGVWQPGGVDGLQKLPVGALGGDIHVQDGEGIRRMGQVLGNGHADAVLPVVEVGDALAGAEVAKAPVPLVDEVGDGGLGAVEIVVAHAVDVGREDEAVHDHHRQRRSGAGEQGENLSPAGGGEVGAQHQKPRQVVPDVAQLGVKVLAGMVVADEHPVAQLLGGGFHPLEHKGIEAGGLSNPYRLVEIDEEAQGLPLGAVGRDVAQLLGGGEYLLPGGAADAGLAVERHRHRSRRNPQLLRDFFRCDCHTITSFPYCSIPVERLQGLRA